MSSRPLTTTSYAILGLIAIRPRSTYELAQMMRRSLHFIWPRAESNLYAEPKRLVDGGMATAEVSWNGERKRTVYSITPRGAEALRDWLADDPAPQRVESEAAVRILFGHLGTKDDLQAAIARVAADADEWITEVSEVADVYARGDGPFPERIHVNALLATLMIEQARTASRWATWAAEEVERWADAATPDVEWAVRTLRRVLDEEPFSDAP
jgi:PadR family transcriptional regulator, regulatory protein AphA